MVNFKRGEVAGLLAKLTRAIFTSTDTTEETEEAEQTETPDLSTIDDSQAESMQVYWETDKQSRVNRNQPSIDSYLKGNALKRIPDTTEEAVKESHYKFAEFYLSNLPDDLQYRTEHPIIGVTDTPKTGTGISSSGRDAGVVAGIVVAVISGVLILAALIAVVLYKHYVHRNVTSMNFDNPVYRKTTEDQFALEKNGYAPGSKLYPSTVGEEAREPLNTPGTNEYV